MDELFEVAAGADAEPAGRILIVDDDPIVAGMLDISLSAAGHEVAEAESGEAALARLADPERWPAPDVIFLDIEMGAGIDGYETCRRLRATDAGRELPIIFLSGHDGLDDRLSAYNAGGSDFVAKPFDPEEVLRKAGVSIRHKRRQEAMGAQKRDSFNAAMTALTTLGESGVTLQFTRDALACHTLMALAKLTLRSMASFGLDCIVQLRAPSGTLTQTAAGPASPLEESVLEKSRAMGRLFSFGNRMIVNYHSVSILVTNMPVADDDLCGRIRDHAAMIAEAAERAVDNINLRVEVVQRAAELQRLADASHDAVAELRSNYRDLQLATRHELETMVHSIEHMYISLGLTDPQEFAISDVVRNAVEKVLLLFEYGSKLDQRFSGIVEALARASEHEAAQGDDSSGSVEVW